MPNFINIPQEDYDQAQLDRAFAQTRRIFGYVPEHLELLGKISPDLLSDFIQYNLKILRNRRLPSDFFTFLRLLAAKLQNFEYCQKFNKDLLIKSGHKEQDIDRINSLSQIPFDNNLKLLAQQSYKAVFSPSEFTQNDFNQLADAGWTPLEIYTVVDHLALFEKNWRILTAFMKK